MPDETDVDLMILGERARENSIKRNEDMKKKKRLLLIPLLKQNL